ncbi:MAG: AmmeMemoRadiSam system protein B [Candidatus Omnitrophica bacterium]|nr:AmmeMemoRadiSam system protein B [Candidatus Omnitrophota bacterium]
MYPKAAGELREFLDTCEAAPVPVPAISVIVPHGGYQQSGRIAGDTLRAVRIPRLCLLIGPDHLGQGARWSLMTAGTFHTPLGEVPVHTEMAQRLQRACPLLQGSADAHHTEHALETILPFLQAWGPSDLAIVPLLVSGEEAEEIRQVADAIARVLQETEEPVLVVASADLSAYTPAEATRRTDAQLLQEIQCLREDQVLQRAKELRLTSCGTAPIACAVGVARRLGGRAAQVIRYGTSADAGGDPASATGYAGILLPRMNPQDN